jgi:hypothetical protein
VITNTEWLATAESTRPLGEDDIMVLTPYPKVITLIHRHGTFLVRAEHDQTDEKGDIEMLKMICLYRYSGGGTDV